MSLLLCFFLQVSVQLKTINSLVNTFIKDPETAHLGLSMSIRSCTKGEEIYSYNSRVALAPASTFKLISTGAFLEKMGPDFQFTTIIYHSGEIVDGILKGNLIIDSDYDPSFFNAKFGRNDFSLLKNALTEKGILGIDGEIRILQKDLDRVPLDWLVADMGNYYASIPRKFNYNENSFVFYFDTDKPLLSEAPIINSSIFSENYKIINKVKIAQNGSGDKSNIFNHPYSREIFVVGTLPQANNTFGVKGSLSHPEDIFKTNFTQYLTSSGFKLSGKSQPNVTDVILKEIKTFKSPTAQDLSKECNNNSNNFTAESYGYWLSKDKESYQDFVKEWLSGKNMNVKAYNFKDASGLSPSNTISPAAMSEYLFKMNTSSVFTSFFNTIPIVGREGTVASLDSKNISKGRVRAKSGTISTIKSYAGYVETTKNNLYSFSFVVHGLGEKQDKLARKFLESVMVSLPKTLP
jgi:serine-type D-Ala-D-Ala carboxypeptidase/endopeptidase (penicillin-binding protein 4)